MKVADILRIKGSVVKTVPPNETALLLSGQMRAEQIGAFVVSMMGTRSKGLFPTRPRLWTCDIPGEVTNDPSVPVDDEGGRHLLRLTIALPM